MPDAPVTAIPTDDPARGPEPGTALCLSGGGYRAMVFHVGVLWRLYEAGRLGGANGVKRVSSVSGGSITAGMLALTWNKLSFDAAKLQSDFVPEVVAPLRALASETIDQEAILLGIVLPGRVSERVVKAYDEHLFKGATLQDLPNEPRFIINATNVQSGVLWRFEKPYMRDYLVGEVKNPKVSMAQAVAASSAFPPVLSPVELRLDPNTFTPNSGSLQRKPFTSKVILTDGGVYDNLGLETAWKRYQTVLVSDAGGKLQAEEEPKSDWAQHSYRVLSLIDNQVRALRKRARPLRRVDRVDSLGARPEANCESKRGGIFGKSRGYSQAIEAGRRGRNRHAAESDIQDDCGRPGERTTGLAGVPESHRQSGSRQVNSRGQSRCGQKPVQSRCKWHHVGGDRFWDPMALIRLSARRTGPATASRRASTSAIFVRSSA
jgi:NTE family protein